MTNVYCKNKHCINWVPCRKQKRYGKCLRKDLFLTYYTANDDDINEINFVCLHSQQENYLKEMSK